MDDRIDEVLERLSGTGFEFGPGLSNHGPMAAEALVRLGRGEDARRWAEQYRSRLGPAPEPRGQVNPGEWRSALGDVSRVADWTELFRRHLEEMSWQEVLVAWLPRLLPGLMAAATHGVIRTAHAARALRQGETDLRRNELAAGLGYWAARYQELPGRPLPKGRKRISEAVAALPKADKPPPGLIFEAVRAVDGLEGFTDAVDDLGPPVTVEQALSELTATFARIYLGDGGRSPIAFVHTVTAPAALRLLLPYLSAEVHPMALAYAWQACAAIAATYGGLIPERAVERLEVDEEELVDRAVASGDEHAIKFTEACLREHRLCPDAAYLAAALDATRRL